LLFCLLYVVHLYAAGTLFPQTLASTLFLLSLWLHFVWRRSGQTVEAVLQGVVWAALILTVPVFLLNLMVYLLWLMWKRRSLWQVGLIAVIVFVPLMAWSARNRVVFHEWFLADNTGVNLIDGNSRATGPNTGPNVDLEVIVPEVTPQVDELSRDRAYKRAAINWVETHPGRAARLYVLKTLNWFNCEPNLHTARADRSAYRYILAVVYYPLLIAVAISPLVLPGAQRIQGLFAAQYVVAACGYAIFFTRIRFRLPYDYLVIIIAAASVSALLSRSKRTLSPKSIC
jgi:hypothetical protein